MGKVVKIDYTSPHFFFGLWVLYLSLIINGDIFTRWYKYASMGLTAFGVYLIAKHAIQYVMQRRRRWELQRRYFKVINTEIYCRAK